MSEPIIERLGPPHREEVLAVLAAAFHEYPVMRFTLGSTQTYETDLRRLIGFYIDKRLLPGWPVLGVRDPSGWLVAATVVNDPDRDPSPATAAALTALRSAIGEEAFGRMSAFEAACDESEPKTRHYYVGMLGVHPTARGRGHAGRLLAMVHQMAADRGYDGVCLSTEDAGNLPFYRHHGYRIHAEARVDTLTTWTLFRAAG